MNKNEYKMTITDSDGNVIFSKISDEILMSAGGTSGMIGTFDVPGILSKVSGFLETAVCLSALGAKSKANRFSDIDLDKYDGKQIINEINPIIELLGEGLKHMARDTFGIKEEIPDEDYQFNVVVKFKDHEVHNYNTDFLVMGSDTVNFLGCMNKTGMTDEEKSSHIHQTICNLVSYLAKVSLSIDEHCRVEDLDYELDKGNNNLYDKYVDKLCEFFNCILEYHKHEQIESILKNPDLKVESVVDPQELMKQMMNDMTNKLFNNDNSEDSE